MLNSQLEESGSDVVQAEIGEIGVINGKCTYSPFNRDDVLALDIVITHAQRGANMDHLLALCGLVWYHSYDRNNYF